MNAPTDWVSAVAILASGLILGMMFIYFFSRRKAAGGVIAREPEVEELDLELRDLEGRRDDLIAQLRELEDTSSKMTPEQIAAERSRLELQAAEVLRQIDEQREEGVRLAHKSGAPAAAATAAVPAQGATALTGFLWGVGTIVVLGFLGFFVYQSAKGRGEGEGVTGGGPAAGGPMAQQQMPQSDPVVQQLEAQVQKSPDDLDLRIELSRAYLERENLMGVFDQTKYVLEKKPGEPRALTYQALVRLAMGDASDSETMLKTATKNDPMLLDAWVALGWLYAQTDRIPEAEKAMAAAMEKHPEEKARLAEILQQMKQPRPVQQASAGPVDPNAPLPPGHPSLDGAAPGGVDGAAAAMGNQRPAVPADGKTVQIALSLDASAKARAQSGIVYIIVRPAGVQGGPPSAVKRLDISQIPGNIELSSADSMMGQPLPEKMRIDARLDRDGNAQSKAPDDPVAVADGVTAGSKITLNLK